MKKGERETERENERKKCEREKVKRETEITKRMRLSESKMERLTKRM